MMARVITKRKRRLTMRNVYADTNLVQISRHKTLLRQGYLYTDHGNSKSSFWEQKYFILTRRHLIFKDFAEDDMTLKKRSFPILECEPFKLIWKGQIRVPLRQNLSKMMHSASIHWTKSARFTKSKAKLHIATEDEDELKAWVVKLAQIGNCSKLQHRPTKKNAIVRGIERLFRKK